MKLRVDATHNNKTGGLDYQLKYNTGGLSTTLSLVTITKKRMRKKQTMSDIKCVATFSRIHFRGI